MTRGVEVWTTLVGGWWRACSGIFLLLGVCLLVFTYCYELDSLSLT